MVVKTGEEMNGPVKPRHWDRSTWIPGRVRVGVSIRVRIRVRIRVKVPIGLGLGLGLGCMVITVQRVCKALRPDADVAFLPAVALDDAGFRVQS